MSQKRIINSSLFMWSNNAWFSAADACDVIDCQNGGNCMFEDGNWRCDCPDGYRGAICEQAGLSLRYCNMINELWLLTFILSFIFCINGVLLLSKFHKCCMLFANVRFSVIKFYFIFFLLSYF